MILSGDRAEISDCLFFGNSFLRLCSRVSDDQDIGAGRRNISRIAKSPLSIPIAIAERSRRRSQPVTIVAETAR